MILLIFSQPQRIYPVVFTPLVTASRKVAASSSVENTSEISRRCQEKISQNVLSLKIFRINFFTRM